MADIGSVAAAVEADRAALRVRPDLAQQLRAAPLPALGLGEQGHGAVEADRQHVVIGPERGELRTVLYIRAEPADPGGDRLAGLGVAPDFARQGQEAQRRLEIDIGRLHAAQQRHALRLLAVLGLAELQVMAVRALLETDGLA